MFVVPGKFATPTLARCVLALGVRKGELGRGRRGARRERADFGLRGRLPRCEGEESAEKGAMHTKNDDARMGMRTPGVTRVGPHARMDSRAPASAARAAHVGAALRAALAPSSARARDAPMES